eukprot:m.92221 g.92221  ORF g.92221 m.92221 type:complete len:54 (+) comp12980_c0_seq3:3634-3795(+)
MSLCIQALTKPNPMISGNYDLKYFNYDNRPHNAVPLYALMYTKGFLQCLCWVH